MSMINIPGSDPDPFARYRRPVISINFVKGYTIITNLDGVAHSIGREPSIIISYLSKMMGTNGNNNKLRGQFSVSTLESHLENYILNNVLCKTCHNPETVIDKNKIRCKACGYCV